MKIKSLFVDGYKNLRETQVEFGSEMVPYVIIGNNGTGKSNLIEALIQIFIGLYLNSLPQFSFKIEYKANDKHVRIEKDQTIDNWLRVWIDETEITKSRFSSWIRERELRPPFPDLVFCYYSGTCDRTKILINRYNRSYNSLLRNVRTDLDRQFVFSDISQAEWSLLGLFAHNHTALLSQLSLNGIERFGISVVPPDTYDEERDDPRFWGTTGGIRDFLADLDNSAIDRLNPELPTQSNSAGSKRSFYFNLKGLRRVGIALERRQTNFLNMMQALASRKMIQKIEFRVVNRESGAAYGMEDLSEGEKQLLCVIGGLKQYDQTEALILLDEPDTHLNPSWSWEYESWLKYALSSEQGSDSMTLLATHDPVIVSGMVKEQILIATVDNSRLKYFPPVRDPRGQGIANVLTSEFFGLPSSLDKHTQALLDERLKLAFKSTRLDRDERRRLNEINQKLEILGMTISFRDPDYKAYEEQKYSNQ